MVDEVACFLLLETMKVMSLSSLQGTLVYHAWCQKIYNWDWNFGDGKLCFVHAPPPRDLSP